MNMLAKRITDWCNQVYPMKQEQEIAVCYGLELLIENLIKFAGIFLVAALFRMADEVAVFCLVFCPFRMLAGGIHMKTGTGCFLFMLVLIGISLLCQSILVLPWAMRWCMVIFMVAGCWRYAPRDTKKNPIAFESVRTKKKYLSVAFCFFCMLVTECMAAEEIKVLVVSALFLETITILPVADYINENRFQKRREIV